MLRKHKKNGGFTLIEIMVAFFVLTLGMGSVLGMLAATVSRERGAIMRTRIADALPFVEEAVRAKLIQPGELAAITRTPVPFSPFLHWRADFTEMDSWPGEVMVRIGITWQQGGNAREEKFVQLWNRLEPYEVRAARILFGKDAEQ